MTVSDFIAALGGDIKAAKMFGVGRTAVCNWRAWGRLPSRLHLKAHLIAKKKRLKFDPQHTRKSSAS